MPKQNFSVLVVEDLADQRDLWDREIEDFNDNTKAVATFRPMFAATGDEALHKIESNQIDCGIVDLRIPSVSGRSPAQTDAQQGNKVLDEVLNNLPVPVAVVSGYPAEASARVRISPVKLFPKEHGSYQSALHWLASHQELMMSIRSTQRALQRETAKIFHGSLWPRWESKSNKPGISHIMVLRQVTAHLSEYLSLPGNNTQGFNPDEFYFKPPMRERLHTGDLLELPAGMHIILTPQCNMANQYPKHLILAPCVEKKDIWKQLLDRLNSSSKEKKEKAEKELSSFATQAHASSSHFIPPCDGRGPWFVDFQHIITMPCDDIEGLKKKRFASLAPQFIPNLVQRFAAYMGRIGQPDTNLEELAKQLAPPKSSSD